MGEVTKTPQEAFASVSAAFPEYKGREEVLQVIWRSVAKDTSMAEFQYFIGVCQAHELNPLTKEIWCYKDNRGNVITFAGRDGMLAKSQKNPRWNGMRSMEVCKNDVFSMDVANNTIKHVPNFADRGEIIGAYAIVFLKDGEPTIEWAEMATYDKKGSAWRTHKAEMIKKVAELHALKKCFGFSGLQNEYDWRMNPGGTVSPVGTIDVKTDEQWIEELEDLKERADMLGMLSEDEILDCERIIGRPEPSSFEPLHKVLTKKLIEADKIAQDEK